MNNHLPAKRAESPGIDRPRFDPVVDVFVSAVVFPSEVNDSLLDAGEELRSLLEWFNVTACCDVALLAPVRLTNHYFPYIRCNKNLVP
jgi:hypothetical protein